MKLARAALAMTLLTLAAPGAAQTAEENYQAGVAARLAGNPEQAIVLLNRAADAEPENADIHLQAGFAYLALGRLDEAEAAFRRTLALAPDYADARLGLASVAQRRVAVAGENRRWRIDLDGSYSDVDGLPDWQSATLVLQHRAGENTTLAASVEATRRFDRADVYAEARIDYRFAPGNNAYVLIGGTPDADHRPEWQFGGGAGVRTHGGPFATVLRLDLRTADYPAGGIQTVTPGVEQYLTGQVWLTAQWINVWDQVAHSSGWLLRGDVMPSDRLRLFAGVADAPDLDEGVVIDTLSLFGGLSLDLDDRLTLRASLAHDDPEGSADRTTVALGVGYRF
jgi:YaiO family outer membrane protein